MNSNLKDAIRNWELDVERETVELIEAGVAPYEAMERARSIVSARRRNRRRAADPSGQ